MLDARYWMLDERQPINLVLGVIENRASVLDGSVDRNQVYLSLFSVICLLISVIRRLFSVLCRLLAAAKLKAKTGPLSSVL